MVVMDTGLEARPEIDNTVRLPEPSAFDMQAISVLIIPPAVERYVRMLPCPV
jgi:hypothetical protein